MFCHFDDFRLDGFGDKRCFTLDTVERHHRLTLLCREFQALSAQACRGVGHRQPDQIGAPVNGELRVQFDTGIDFLAVSDKLFHALGRFDFCIQRSTSGQRAFRNIFRTQRGDIAHCGKFA